MPEERKELIFGYPQGIGGHGSASDDQMDIRESQGKYRALMNVDPLRSGQGEIVMRGPVINRLSRPSTPIDLSSLRIAQALTQRGVDCVVSGSSVIRDIHWSMYDHATEEYAFALEKYTPSEFYNDSNWSGTFEACVKSTTITAISMNVYPTSRNNVGVWGYAGQGDWIHSARGHVSMAMGAFSTVTNQGPAVPLKAMWVDRRKATPVANGFFPDPNSNADGGGRLEAYKFAIVPEKPWTTQDGLSFDAGYMMPTNAANFSDKYYDNLDTWRVWRKSGNFYKGTCRFWVYPIDENGEPGPPIAVTNLKVPSSFTPPGEQFGYVRGVSVFLRLKNFAGAITEIRPNIIALDVYMTYEPWDPSSELWTQPITRPTEGTSQGFGLDTPPPAKRGFVKRIYLNNRQFDPTSNDSFAGGTLWTAQSFAWTRSGRWNVMINRDGSESIPATKSGAAELTIPSSGLLGDGGLTFGSKGEFLWAYQFGGRIGASAGDNYGATTFLANQDVQDKVQLEVFSTSTAPNGTFGTTRVDTWSYDFSEASIVLTTADNLPGNVGDTLNVRFVHPWQVNSSGNYQVNIWINGPEDVDQSRPLPFPKEATSDYNVGYISFKHHCESPSGNVRKAWNVWDNGVKSDNVLYSTTKDAQGNYITTRFLITEEFPGTIHGCQYLTNTSFIVSTSTGSFLYEDYIDADGILRMREIEKSLQFGNGAYVLGLHRRTIYGIDPAHGVWGVGIDVDRQRTDISPVGMQSLLMTYSQQKIFRDLVSGMIDEEWENVSIVGHGDKVYFVFPQLTGDASGGGKNNISMRGPAANGSFWITLNYVPGGVEWTYDFVRSSASKTISSTATGGAGKTGQIKITTSAAHGLAEGDEIFIFPTANMGGRYVCQADTAGSLIYIIEEFVATETGTLYILGDEAHFFAHVGAGNTVWHSNDQTAFSNLNPYDTDAEDQSDRGVMLYIEPPDMFLSNYPTLVRLESYFLRMIGWFLTPAANTIRVTVQPLLSGVLDQGVLRTAISAGWQRGIKAIGEAFRIRIACSASGTPRLQGIQFLVKLLSKKRGR